jgi:hypothetical protein
MGGFARCPRNTAASSGGDDYMGMVVATEELSRRWASAGLITRPEILTRALVGHRSSKHGGAEIASAETMVAVAVTG